jgi:hypothetical protein
MGQNIILSGRSARALTRQMERMERSAALTKLATTELGGLYREAAFKATTTVDLARHLVNAATYSGRMTPAKQAAFHRRTQDYLDEIACIAEEEGLAILRLVAA